MTSVLLPWVEKMSWKCQSILQGGFRGPDVPNVPAIKKVNRWLRTVSQQNADASKDYMRNDGLPTDYELCNELEFCTCHYAHHLADALRCVAIYHTESEIREQAYNYHYRIAEELFHFAPESSQQFIDRHRDQVVHPADVVSKSPPTHVELTEGADWMTWSDWKVCRHKASGVLHAITFADGSVFDAYNGWRGVGKR